MLDVSKERNPEILRKVCGAYEKANGQLIDKIRELTQKLADLEGLDAAQVGLDLPDVEVGPSDTPTGHEEQSSAHTPAATSRAPQAGHGPTPQPNLLIQPLHHGLDRLPDCSACGRTMSVWGGQFEESEEIDVIESSFRILLHRRQKYRCRCNSNVITAPGRAKLIPGGRYSLDFAVHSAIAKFCDHIPLERQVRQMQRQALTVTSQTLWDQQAALAKHLEPTWKALCSEALKQPVLHADETGWRMMGSKTNAK